MLVFSKSNNFLIASAIAVTLAFTPIAAQSLDIGELFSAGSNLFESLSSGDFSIGNIFNIANDVSSVSGNFGGPTIGGFAGGGVSLGNLTSSGNADYSFGSGSFSNDTFDPTQSINGDYSTTEGDFLGEGGGGFGLNQRTLQQAARSSEYVRGLYGSIQKGNIGGSIQNVIGILDTFGLFGIEDPSEVSSRQGSAGAVLGNSSVVDSSSLDDELARAKYPIDVYYVGQKRQNIYRTSNHDLSQIVLSKLGQKFIADQAKEQGVAIGVSEQANQQIAKYVGNSAQLNQSQEKAVKSAEKIVDKGVKTRQTLDGIHALIGIAGVHSGQFSLLSGGQTLNTAALAQLGRQVKANTAVNKINGDTLRTIAIQSAATNNGVSLMSADIDAMHRHDLEKEASQMSLVTQSQETFLVPELFSIGGGNGSTP